MSGKRNRTGAIALGSIALLATLGIGFFAARAVSRSPVSTPRDQPANALELLPALPLAPELLGWRFLRSVPIALVRPRGIALAADGTIWACGDRALLAVERGGAARSRFALESEPTCVAAGTDGRIYVGATDHLEVVDPSAGSVTLWPSLGPEAIVTSVAASAAGVIVADAGNRMLLRFDADGRLDGVVGSGYAVPSPYFDVAAAPDGTLVVADPGARSVRRYSSGGDLLGTWGTSSAGVEGFVGCCNPAHLAILLSGSVVTSEKGLLRVKVHEPEGRLESVVASAADFPPGETSLDLAAGSAEVEEILVLVPRERSVRIYVRKEVASDG